MPVEQREWHYVIKELARDNKWEVVNMLMVGTDQQIGLEQVAKGCGTREVDVGALVKHLDEKDLVKWGENLAVILLEEGASPSTFRSNPPESPHLFALRLGLKTGCFQILRYLLKSLGEDCKQHIDDYGNSAMHIVVKFPDKNTNRRERAAKILLWYNFPVDTRDRHGKLPVDYLEWKDQLRKVLRRRPSKLDDERNTMGFKSAVRNKTSKMASPLSYRRNLSIVFSNRSAVHLKSNQREKALRDAEISITCDPNFWKGYWHKGMALKSLENYTDAFKMFRKGFKKVDTGDNYRDCFVQAVILMKLKPLKEISRSFLTCSESSYGKFLHWLAIQDRWKDVDDMISVWKENKGSGKSIAKRLDICQVLKSDSLQDDVTYRYNVIERLLNTGASPRPLSGDMQGDEPVQLAIEKRDYRVIALLIDHGADPRTISILPNDTPLHAALYIGIHLEKGYFELFEKLQLLFSKDCKKYSYLNSSCVDSENNSLFHIAVKCEYTTYARKAVEILLEWHVPWDRKDNPDKTPIQYLTKDFDARKALLESAVRRDRTSQKRTKTSPLRSPVEKKSPSPTNTLSEKDRTEETRRRECRQEILNHTTNTLSKKDRTEETRRRECRQEILNHINSLPDFVHGGSSRDKNQKQTSALEAYGSDIGNSSSRSDSSSPTDLDDLGIADAIQKGLLEEDDDTFDKDLVGIETKDDHAKLIAGNVFDNLLWEVECTEHVWKNLRNRLLPMDFKQRTINKIQKLASGEWTKSLVKDVHNVPKDLKLYEAKISKGGRIIWELAVTFSARDDEGMRGQIYSEVIRVWDIVLQHDHLYRRIKRIRNSFERGQKSAIKTTLKCLSPSQDCETSNAPKRPPRIFKNISDDNMDHLGSGAEYVRQHVSPASLSESEFTLMKFYAFSDALIDVIYNTQVEIEIPFKASPTEHAIISLPPDKPVLLVGRSGTGKTTCCLYRLWDGYVKYWMKASEALAPLIPPSVCSSKSETDDSSRVPIDHINHFQVDDKLNDGDDKEEIYEHLRQIFVTKNAVFCKEVMKRFQQLKPTLGLKAQSPLTEADSLPNRLSEVPADFYPLFITSKKLLLMLDASLPGPSFFERDDDGTLKRDINGWTDSDINTSTVLELQYDSDRESDSEEIEVELGGKTSKSSTLRKREEPKREVTYDVFSEELWQKICKTKNHQPSLIWMEIRSFIKGLSEALNTTHGHLTLEQYKLIGRKRAPNFTGSRDKVFEIFLNYERVKKQKRMFDECDLLFHISNRISKSNYHWKVHQLYVDETQDFTQAELAVLLRLCQNPNKTFLSGDTAQGIMRGISFRFKDLKSLFHYARESSLSKATAVPKCVNLFQNYRSHTGILSLASSVIDIMKEFFADSFDILENDQGYFEGPLPILLEFSNLAELVALVKGKRRRQTSQIEFGAHQAILVVDQNAKKVLPHELQRGNVLTIYAAKGLEFDDVLLVNFFKNSKASKEWRVVTKYLHQLAGSRTSSAQTTTGLIQVDIDTMNTSTCRPLAFDVKHHNILCEELKLLYTALTRARVHLWIFDEDCENRKPMFDYFKSRKLVHSATDSAGFNQRFAQKSTTAEWNKRGDDFMAKHLYEMAAKCYNCAGNLPMTNQAEAHCAALRASKLRNNPAKMRQEFLLVAQRFLIQCGMLPEAAKCLQGAKERELAARLYEKTGQFEKAADLFEKCNLSKEATRCLKLAGNKCQDAEQN